MYSWRPNDRIYVGEIEISNWGCFLKKNNAWEHAKRENTFSGQSVSHIPSPLFVGQPLLEPLFGLLLSVIVLLAMDEICVLYQRLSRLYFDFLDVMVLPSWDGDNHNLIGTFIWVFIVCHCAACCWQDLHLRQNTFQI